MITREDEVGCILGRFQFLHEGHEDLIREAVKHCNTLFILVGSAEVEGTEKNPMSFHQRKLSLEIFIATLNTDTVVEMHPVGDSSYDDEIWLNCLIANLVLKTQIDIGKNKVNGDLIPLYCFNRGHDLEDRSGPMHDYFNVVDLGAERVSCSSTGIRAAYYKGLTWDASIHPRISEYIRTLDLSDAELEYKTRTDYEYTWEAANREAPWPLPHLDCVDLIVHEGNGEVLLIERAKSPGKGKIAMPGGFVDRKDYSFEVAACRELKEETGIIVNPSDLVHVLSLKGTQRGGNRNTHVYKVNASKCTGAITPDYSEVNDVFWKPFPQVGERFYFADHLSILHVAKKGIKNGE